MQEACDREPSGMTSILGLDLGAVKEVVTEAAAHAPQLVFLGGRVREHGDHFQVSDIESRTKHIQLMNLFHQNVKIM